MMCIYKCISSHLISSQNIMQQPHPATIVIEAWIHPLSALTPSLIMHNLELQGVQLPQSLTIAVDRGHYDCADTNYAVVTVSTNEPILFMHFEAHPQSFYCSFFSHNAVQGMDPVALYPHWLGNCYLHVGEPAVPGCSFRHESGHAKTWKKAAPLPSPTVKAYHLRSAPPAPAPAPASVQDDDAMSAVSVEPEPTPVCPSPRHCHYNHHNNHNKKDLRIIQLQKKNLALRTELDMLKSEFRDLKRLIEAIDVRDNSLASTFDQFFDL